MSNLSRHIRQVHNNESTECPDCGKALTISNLNKHIKSVHKKLKKTCDICNEEVPYSSISVHKRKVHNIGKPIDDVTPRGPNLKLRKRYFLLFLMNNRLNLIFLGINRCRIRKKNLIS